ncbi:MAG: hypothetical protein IKF53_05930 [Clostridia bacterium]|nr:hypothetical protein [Clostridia bacterium]
MKIFKLNNIKLPLDTDFGNLIPVASKQLKISKEEIEKVSLFRKSVDARKKTDVHFVVTLLVFCKNDKVKIKNKNAVLYNEKEYKWAHNLGVIPKHRPIVTGFGPCGMFAALTLARAGLNPLVLERGSEVDKRTSDVAAFFKTGKLNPDSNVQFGEGGAGTFSDGKLTTGIKDIRCRAVLKEFYTHGADISVTYDAKPHIGTDVLKTVVKNIRNEIISLGGEIRFDSSLQRINTKNNKVVSVTVNGEDIPADCVILSTGHSARDTFKMLKDIGVSMEKKPFSVGVRIEHLQKDINRALYGPFADSPYLGSADYKLSVHLENGRGVYTFCMCPGGEVINSSSENGAIAVNGMSNSKRDGENANSALLVGVLPEDFSGDVLSGLYFQEKIEKAAHSVKNGAVPIDTVGHFVYKGTAKIGKIKPTVKPETVFCDLEDIFPHFVTESLKKGIVEFAKKIEGFDDKDAILTAPETRSSSPVRILRDENGVSNFNGLYPAGEGAGYAGGIMSAAVDGIKTAEKVIDQLGFSRTNQKN